MPPVTEQSDSALVELTRAGDSGAFAELWRRHARAALTVARSHTSTFEADDLISEAYAKIYQAIVAGGGPTTAFRAYLFTTIRNIAASWGRAKQETAIDDLDAVEDPAFSESATMEALDRSLTATAFHSLPTRWQEVLWYCEVEGMTPQQVAPLFAMTPNAVAALAYRAREGLRQAWVQAHLVSLPEDSACRWTTERLGAYARHGLGKRETAKVDAHLGECAKCTIVASEASDVGSRLALVLLPLTLGIGGAAAYSAWLQSGADTATYAIGQSGAVVPGSAAPSAGPSGGGAVSGGAVSGGAASGSSAGTGGALGIGLTIAGVLVAAAVAAGFVLGPQLFAPTSGPISASGSQTGDGTRTDPSGADPADSTDETAPEAPVPAVPLPVPVVPVLADPAPTDATPASPAPTQPGPSPDESGSLVPSVPATPSAPTTPTAPAATPPAAPTIASPSGRTETAAPSLPASGTAAPDALIVVSAQKAEAAAATAGAPFTAASTPASVVVGSTRADSTGAWTLTLDLSALGDGDWTLGFVQTTASGTSPAQSSSVFIDRTAEAPALNVPDTGSGSYAGLLSPILSGTAEPGARVEVSDHGTLQSTVTASADGTWTTGQLTGVQVGFALTARQTDRLGNVSAASDPLTGSIGVPVVEVVTMPGMSFLMTVTGAPGTTVRLSADGDERQNVLQLDSHGHAAQLFEWVRDDTVAHRFGVAYADGDRRGLLVDQPVTLY